jgi:hypothetical protein
MYASPSADPASGDLQLAPVRAALCEAAGCGRALSLAQVAKEARACSPRCRVAAHRERRKRARLGEIDRAIAVLQELRAEVSRG